jgi:hypothetical protein
MEDAPVDVFRNPASYRNNGPMARAAAAFIGAALYGAGRWNPRHAMTRRTAEGSACRKLRRNPTRYNPEAVMDAIALHVRRMRFAAGKMSAPGAFRAGPEPVRKSVAA